MESVDRLAPSTSTLRQAKVKAKVKPDHVTEDGRQMTNLSRPKTEDRRLPSPVPGLEMKGAANGKL